jgi:hypothetical protein
MRPVRWFPVAILALLVPSWASYLLIDERDDFDTENPLFFHVPDLSQDPLGVVFTLLVTPVVNTEGDQVILVTVLLLAFGTVVERRLGSLAALGIFWGASIVAAIVGGFILHLLHPTFAHLEVIDVGWRRVFNGGSAGGFALLGALAATSGRPWIWLGLFAIWEPGFWLLVSQDFTSVFHLVAVATGFSAASWIIWARRKGGGPAECR